jgi:hypothetical protein
MTFSELVNKYKQQIAICSQIDYDNKKTIIANNRAVHTMYKLIDVLKRDFTGEEVVEFAKLLDMKEHNTNVWVAAQMLERLDLSNDLQIKALTVIKEVAAGDSPEALGFKIWLKNWKTRSR